MCSHYIIYGTFNVESNCALGFKKENCIPLAAGFWRPEGKQPQNLECGGF